MRFESDDIDVKCFQKYGHTNWTYAQNIPILPPIYTKYIEDGKATQEGDVYYWHEAECMACEEFTSSCSECKCREDECQCSCGYCAGYVNEEVEIEAVAPEDYIETMLRHLGGDA